MVHRPPDSRLLANLINHEKEYAKHLAALFPLSHAALASLSAYAAASPSTQPASPAHSIAVAVDVLASADNALQRYTSALDTWREQLVGLKDLEDDVSGVLRDRDILVTRLIKASKSTRDAHRSSRLVAPLTSLGSASFSSLPSTNSTALSSTGSSPASTNAKLAQAQAELQACEAHLVSKEHELDTRRLTLARDGLGARCRALIDCGWVWCEMGKQGLRALQALSADENTPKPSLSISPRLSTNPIAYASDHSSLTPSQSASQTAARSVETSQEDPASKELQSSKPLPRPSNDEDLTITVPPAHVISEVALPTSVRTSLDNGDSTVTVSTTAQPAPVPRRKRTRRVPRPHPQHITEASDEGSDASPSASRTANANANTNATISPRIPHLPFPTSRATETHDTSSDDEHTGPLQVVENDPFEVIRRSMLGPPDTAPIARASAPDVRMSTVMDPSPTTVAFSGSSSVQGHGQRRGMETGTGIGLGTPPGTSPGKRQRRTSMAFFGSLRGLFRKPKERERAAWEESRSPSPASPSRRTRTGGWVTRTDARIKGRCGEDSDEGPVSTVATTTKEPTKVVCTPSGTRLRKGRPSAPTRENGSRVPPHRTTIDGWITDAPGTGVNAASPVRSRTRRGTVRRKKTSVADLRGDDQGHTDGEVDDTLERVTSKGRAKAPKVIISGPELVNQEGQPPLRNPISVFDAYPTADTSAGNQPKRAATTTATLSRRPSSDVAPVHHRSASLSLADAHTVVMSASSSSSSSQGTSQSMSWRKPPPKIEPVSHASAASSSPSQSQSQAQSQTLVEAETQIEPSRTQESQPKPNAARRHLGNGHAKHVQNQSLMSIVADVARQSLEWERDKQRVMDRARSLDITRVPGSGSVMREREGGENVIASGRHAKAVGDDVLQGQAQGPERQRGVKMPLRSALRNASRTPSPSPGPPSVITNANANAVVPVRQVNKKGVDEERGRVVSPTFRDSASISSYETGRESLDGNVEKVLVSSPPRSPPLRAPSPTRAAPRSASQPPMDRPASPVLIQDARAETPPELLFTFPPPPVDPPPVQSASNPNSITNASEPPSPNVSTATETQSQPAQRRKSVRVSLQPTFSPTPPDEDGEYAPWDGGRESRDKVKVKENVKAKSRSKENSNVKAKDEGKTRDGDKTKDVWADSSEEDEAYSRARRLLSLVGRT